jgi:hypothetical protein
MAMWTRFSLTEEDDFFGRDEPDWEDTDTAASREYRDGRCMSMGLAAKEAAAVEAQYRTLGYHETYECSQEATMQDGFTDGYYATFETATRIGRLLGIAAARTRLLQETSEPLDPSQQSIHNDDTAFLAAASRIRVVLQTTTAAQEPEYMNDVDAAPTVEPRRNPQVLEGLEREVECILGIDSAKDAGGVSNPH